MNLIFFWRLTREKGFDLLLASLRSMIVAQNISGNCYLFWDGPLRDLMFSELGSSTFFHDLSRSGDDMIREVISQSENIQGRFPPTREWRDFNIFFFSWRSQELIREFLQVSDYCLMPSRFLETFGLSALESLAEGVPVIGFKKWGLIPFVDPRLAIDDTGTDTDRTESLTSLLQFVSTVDKSVPNISAISDLRTSEKWWNSCEKWAPEWDVLASTVNEEAEFWTWSSHFAEVHFETKSIAEKYIQTAWIGRIRNMIGSAPQKILLCSDYLTSLGGIETHVANIGKILTEAGYETETFGWNIPKGKYTQILRLLGLPFSLINFRFAKQLKSRSESTDVVWLHSISRFLGPQVMKAAVGSGKTTMITYHDLGMFATFPSDITDESMIMQDWSFRSFVRSNTRKWIIALAALPFKYWQISWLRKYIRQVDHHIIPSEFLRPHVRRLMDIPDERIHTIGHF